MPRSGSDFLLTQAESQSKSTKAGTQGEAQALQRQFPICFWTLKEDTKTQPTMTFHCTLQAPIASHTRLPHSEDLGGSRPGI